MEIFHLQNQVRRRLEDLGFNPIRFTSPPLGKAKDLFNEWLRRDFHGEMAYLERRMDERIHPQQLLAGLQSIIVVGHSYDSGGENTKHPSEGNVSRYALGEDYHQVLREKLLTFSEWLKKFGPESHIYFTVDSSPVLEKAWAEKSGLGWIGKHTNVINRESGSYFFLATVLTNLPFESDPQEEDHCGSCQACIDVCPTGAIIAPYVLDARLCISYLTIELKGPIPRNLRPMIGNRIFGCDDCQEVCPWNRFSRPTGEERFFPREEIFRRPLNYFLTLSPSTFREIARDSAIARPKWKGFMRNVLVAAGNSGDISLAPLVAEKLSSEEVLVRGHAVWAYERLLGKESFQRLRDMQQEERDPWVLEEIKLALGAVRV